MRGWQVAILEEKTKLLDSKVLLLLLLYYSQA